MKTTAFTKYHIAAGAKMAEFAGYNMPIEFTGINDEHMTVRNGAGVFDVSHMGEIWVKGPKAEALLQRITTNDVAKLYDGKVQYSCMPNGRGGIVDDILVYRIDKETYMLCVNAANIDKDLEHLNRALAGFDCTITNISDQWASIAVQGPKSKEMLMTLTGGESPTKEPTKNSLGTVSLEGRQARIAKTGYTGEPLGYEVYVRSEDAVWLWNRLVELGARPAGLGARDTLRMEASFPLYGHEMGTAPDGSEIPIFAVPLAKFAVSFSAQKGDFIGRAALERQHQAFIRHMDRDFSDLSPLPRRIAPIALLDRGVMRAGMEIYQGDKLVGWVTSGTMVPYFKTQGQGLSTVILEASGKRAIGLCYIDSDVLEDDEEYQNPVDLLFEELAKKKPNSFAGRQYKLYKLAAGKTAKSILISCGARLAPFDIQELRDLTMYDELQLDTLGDKKTALFLIMSDTDSTFNFLISMVYTQLFNLLCDKADDVYGGKLPIHVRCLIDECANIGQIPNLEKLVATIRSREISACLVLQARSQLKAIYKDNADTIVGNMDSQIFLGGSEPTTLKDLSEMLGKETIDAFNTSDTRGNSPSYGTTFQKMGHELLSRDELAVLDGGKCILQLRGVRPFLSDKYDLTQHPNYKLTSDYDPKNTFDIEKYLNRKEKINPNDEFVVIDADSLPSA